MPKFEKRSEMMDFAAERFKEVVGAIKARGGDEYEMMISTFALHKMYYTECEDSGSENHDAALEQAKSEAAKHDPKQVEADIALWIRYSRELG